jgi:hypothetical protein
VTSSPLFNAASCGANPGAYITYSTINSLQVATDISTCPGGSYCTGERHSPRPVPTARPVPTRTPPAPPARTPSAAAAHL